MKKCKICKLPNTGIGTKHFHCSPPNKKSKVKKVKAWTIKSNIFDIFMKGKKGDYRWARILKTKKQTKEEYPCHQPQKVEIKILC